MRKIRDFIHGIQSHNVDKTNGFVIYYSSGYMPHGRMLCGRLISPNGQDGSLKITCKSRYDRPFDIHKEINLDSIETKKWHDNLYIIKSTTHDTRICDGWRIGIRGFKNNCYFTYRYVIGNRDECRDLASSFESIDDRLIKIGSV